MEKPLSSPKPPDLGAMLSLLALTVLGLIGGWLVLLLGGFHHSTHSRTTETIFVSGPPALAMAAISLSMAAVGVAALLQTRGQRPAIQWLGAAGVLLPAIVYVLAGHFAT